MQQLSEYMTNAGEALHSDHAQQANALSYKEHANSVREGLLASSLARMRKYAIPLATALMLSVGAGAISKSHDREVQSIAVTEAGFATVDAARLESLKNTTAFVRLHETDTRPLQELHSSDVQQIFITGFSTVDGEYNSEITGVLAVPVIDQKVMPNALANYYAPHEILLPVELGLSASGDQTATTNP